MADKYVVRPKILSLEDGESHEQFEKNFKEFISLIDSPNSEIHTLDLSNLEYLTDEHFEKICQIIQKENSGISSLNVSGTTIIINPTMIKDLMNSSNLTEVYVADQKKKHWKFTKTDVKPVKVNAPPPKAITARKYDPKPKTPSPANSKFLPSKAAKIDSRIFSHEFKEWIKRIIYNGIIPEGATELDLSNLEDRISSTDFGTLVREVLTHREKNHKIEAINLNGTKMDERSHHHLAILTGEEYGYKIKCSDQLEESIKKYKENEKSKVINAKDKENKKNKQNLTLSPSVIMSNAPVHPSKFILKILGIPDTPAAPKFSKRQGESQEAFSKRFKQWVNQVAINGLNPPSVTTIDLSNLPLLEKDFDILFNDLLNPISRKQVPNINIERLILTKTHIPNKYNDKLAELDKLGIKIETYDTNDLSSWGVVDTKIIENSCVELLHKLGGLRKKLESKNDSSKLISFSNPEVELVKKMTTELMRMIKSQDFNTRTLTKLNNIVKSAESIHPEFNKILVECRTKIKGLIDYSVMMMIDESERNRRPKA